MDMAAGSKEFQKVQRQLKEMMREGISLSGKERNVCFLNLGRFDKKTNESQNQNPGFATISSISGFDFQDDARSVSIVDWDFDGDLDLWVTNRSAPQARFLRNDFPQGHHHFIAFRLKGTTCNRDAIGSRVEIVLPDGSKRLETLRAGGGYLSQSSKWVHFGLGKDTEVKEVKVYWADGTDQRWVNPAIDKFHVLQQGKAEAKQFLPPIQTHSLAANKDDDESDSYTTRALVLLPNPIPILDMAYSSYYGETKRVKTSNDRATLLVVWSSFCPICKGELQSLADEKAHLVKLGVDVIALSVNGVGNMIGTARGARDYLRRIKFPFETGSATEIFLDKIQFLHRQLFYRPYTLPVPVSFLISKDGEIVAVYRGEVSLDVLATHIEHLNNTSPTVQPGIFAGKWIGERHSLDRATTVLKIVDQGWIDDAISFFERNRKHIEEKKYVRIIHLLAAKLLEKNGRSLRARTYLEEVIERDPNYEQAWSNLGVIAYHRGNIAAAESYYRKAIKLDPTYPAPRKNLSNLLIKTRRPGEAVEHLRVLIKLAPDDIGSRYRLGAALAEIRNLDSARDVLEKLLLKSKDHAQAKIALAKVYYLLGEFAKAGKMVDDVITSLSISRNEQMTLRQLRLLIERRKQQP